MFSITVTGGTGSISLNFGNLYCEALSINSPDDTPNYDIAGYNQNGSFVIGATDITVQKAKINENFRLIGVCVFMSGTSLASTRISAISKTAVTFNSTSFNGAVIYYMCMGAP